MIDMHQKLAEQLNQFTRFQKDALETFQTNGNEAVGGVEKLARYQMDVMKDVVSFGMEQARIGTSAESPFDFFSQQIDAAAALGKTVEKRTNEYIELLTHAADSMRENIRAATDRVADAAPAE